MRPRKDRIVRGSFSSLNLNTDGSSPDVADPTEIMAVGVPEANPRPGQNDAPEPTLLLADDAPSGGSKLDNDGDNGLRVARPAGSDGPGPVPVNDFETRQRII